MKKEYCCPDVIVNDSISEGVYAASGDVECWTIDVTLAQADAGGYANFRVSAKHNPGGRHISSQTEFTVTFNKNITNAYCEGNAISVAGNVVKVTRELHGNAYGNGDNFNVLLNVYADDLAGLAVVDKSIVCTHKTNVQGEYD